MKMDCYYSAIFYIENAEKVNILQNQGSEADESFQTKHFVV